MLSRTCVAIEIKWKKAGVFNRDLRSLQFLIVIEWITSKHFDVILPHPIKDVYVETADPARYNDCRYVRSRWHVYTYTVGSLEFVISLSLSPVRPTFLTFPFLPLFRRSSPSCFFLHFHKISTRLLLPLFVTCSRRSSRFSETFDFHFSRIYIYLSV